MHGCIVSFHNKAIQSVKLKTIKSRDRSKQYAQVNGCRDGVLAMSGTFLGVLAMCSEEVILHSL